jgi:hypothetical protein
MHRLLLAVLTFVLSCPAVAQQAAPNAPAEKVVLGTSGFWRTHYTLGLPLIAGDGEMAPLELPAKWLHQDTAGPADNWQAVDFDDSTWLRTKMFDPDSPLVTRFCARGRFVVDAPRQVGPLNLSLTYRGGVAVYLNGKEIARGHLPEGKITNDTLAEPYPPDAPLGKADPQVPERKLAVTIEPSDLAAGSNVLAVEVRRAVYPKAHLDYDKARPRLHYGTCGITTVRLAAAGDASGISASAVRQPGLQVWNSDVLASDFDADFGDPAEPLGAIRIIAARGGSFSGKVVVGCDKPIEQLSATLGPMRSAGGDTIPSSAAKIRYALPGGDEAETTRRYRMRVSRLDLLDNVAPDVVEVIKQGPTYRSRRLDHAPADIPGAVVGVWVTVEVPRDTPAGTYQAALTISAKGHELVTVPVTLTVIPFRLPAARDWRTVVEITDSPESVAMRYDVELYSDAHFALLEQSAALLAQLDSDVVNIPLICETNLGNEQSMVRWIAQEDGSYRYDFSVLDRYLDVVEKHRAKPMVICLYVWDTYLDGGRGGAVRHAAQTVKDARNAHAGKGPIVSVLDPSTGKIEKRTLPPYADEASEALWRPLMHQLRQRLAKRGLDKAMMIGMSTDNVPTDAILALFKKIDPNLQWVNHAHPTRTNLGDVKVGYTSGVWRGGTFPKDPSEGRLYGWKKDWLQVHHPRNTRNHFPMTTWRFMGEMNTAGNQRGFARIGAEFWWVIVNRRGQRTGTLSARFPQSSWRNLDIHTSILAPGPQGPVATTRFEMMREGLQASETRIYLEGVLTDEALRAKVGEDLARRCQDILDARTRAMLRSLSTLRMTGVWTKYAYVSNAWWQTPGVLGSQWFAACDWQQRLADLYDVAAEVQQKLE